jgi:hypothetical protein
LQGLAFIGLRPNLTDDPSISEGSKAERLAQYFDVSAFSHPDPYTFGSTPRTLPNVRAPFYFVTNLSLARDFKFIETTRLQIRGEAFNLFNRANFSIPVTTLGAANFGVTTSTEDPRQFQIAARVYF